jgi:hypothetical protein
VRRGLWPRLVRNNPQPREIVGRRRYRAVTDTPGRQSRHRARVGGLTNLFEGGRNVAEGCIQLGAEVLDNGDNREGDARSDDGVFGCRGTRLVIHKAQDHSLQPKRSCPRERKKIPRGGERTAPAWKPCNT